MTQLQIYDELIYDEINLFLRSDAPLSGSTINTLSQYFSIVLTESLFDELIDADTLLLQNGLKATFERMQELKNLLSNKFLTSKNLTQKSYNKILNFLLKNDNYFHKNTDVLLYNEFVNAKAVEHAVELKYLGKKQTKQKWNYIFGNNTLSDLILTEIISIQSGVTSTSWIESLVEYQKLEPNIVNFLVSMAGRDALFTQAILLAKGYEINYDLFIKLLSFEDADELYMYDTFFIDAFIHLIDVDRNYFEDPYNWNKILKPIIEYFGLSRNIIKKLLLRLIQVEDLNNDILTYIAPELNNLKFDKNEIFIPEINAIRIEQLTGNSNFLSDDIKSIFLI